MKHVQAIKFFLAAFLFTASCNVLFAASQSNKITAAQLATAREYISSQFRKATNFGLPRPTLEQILKVCVADKRFTKPPLRSAYAQLTDTSNEKKQANQEKKAETKPKKAKKHK